MRPSRTSVRCVGCDCACVFVSLFVCELVSFVCLCACVSLRLCDCSCFIPVHSSVPVGGILFRIPPLPQSPSFFLSSLSASDWSTDGRHLQSSCVAYELLFHDITADLVGSKQNTSATAVKNVQWVRKLI